jgi:hypothetical protein
VPARRFPHRPPDLGTGVLGHRPGGHRRRTPLRREDGHRAGTATATAELLSCSGVSVRDSGWVVASRSAGRHGNIRGPRRIQEA